MKRRTRHVINRCRLSEYGKSVGRISGFYQHDMGAERCGFISRTYSRPLGHRWIGTLKNRSVSLLWKGRPYEMTSNNPKLTGNEGAKKKLNLQHSVIYRREGTQINSAGQCHRALFWFRSSATTRYNRLRFLAPLRKGRCCFWSARRRYRFNRKLPLV